MSILINTLYCVLTWLSAVVIGGHAGDEWLWLVWCLVAMAALQTWGVLWLAVRSLK